MDTDVSPTKTIDETDPTLVGPKPPSWRDIEPPRDDELLVIVGPTASGKTELALRLAERFDGEIISADSVQIYRDYDIGSGKPSAEEEKRAPHHLVSIADPLAPIDAMGFSALAEHAIADVRSRRRLPIVCGGTFLWVKSLVFGLAPAPPANVEIREKHAKIASLEGRAALHAELCVKDPESASRLAPNDFVRVSRALEIYELSGKPQSQFFREHGFREPKHPSRLVGVALQRDKLDQNIRSRVQKWLGSGWIEEVTQLLEKGHQESRAMGSVGYKQVRTYVEGGLKLSELEDTIVRATRVFARRQRTWLRDQPVAYHALDDD